MEKMAEQILALTPVPSIVLDPSFHVVQVSASLGDLTKSTPGQHAGLNIYELGESLSPLPHLASFREAIENAAEAKKITVLKGILGENESTWNLRLIPIVDKDTLLFLVLEFEDITIEYPPPHSVIEESVTNDTYRILVETVKDYAIFMLDIHGNVSTWNSGAALMKRYTREEIVGHHFSKFYSEEDRIADKPGRELRECLRDGKVLDEGWRYRKDGTRFWASVTITAVYRRDAHIGFSKVTRDLTERKAAEASLIAAYEQSDRLKSEFLANMSHEIRTPMHGMLSAQSLLVRTPLNAEQRELTAIIEESGSVLLQVINDILDYSKLSSGCFSLSSEHISVPEIINSVIRSSQATLRPGVKLDTSIDKAVPHTAKGDPLRYRQIIQNLVANAVKFTYSGTITLLVSVLEEDKDSYTVLTEVKDTGIGVEAKDIKSLFNPFTQLDNSMTKRHQGTGLGLSICKSLTHLMGGEIAFRANPQQRGSIFWFTVKLSKLDLPTILTNVTERSILSKATKEDYAQIQEIAPKKTLLLTEDNSINQRIMLKMLKSFGFEKVHTAVNGKDSASLAKEHAEVYDLILMDINMPVLDGVGATTQIRASGNKVPIIAMTANALKGDAEAYLASGMNDYVPKPINQQHLLVTLLKWLKI